MSNSKFRFKECSHTRESFKRGKDTIEKEEGYEIVHTQYNNREMVIYVYDKTIEQEKKRL